MRVLALLAVAYGALFAGASSAWGCSCAYSTDAELRERYAASDAAFVGTAIERREVEMTAYTTFTVEEDFKGNLPDEVVVRSHAYGATCGLEVPNGTRTGLLAGRDGEQWTSGLCQQVEPERLREAASAPPPPENAGTPFLFAGGALGEYRVAAFDSDGDLAGYGPGAGTATQLDVCPGGDQLGEAGYDEAGAPFAAVRDAETLALRDEEKLDFAFGEGFDFACRGDDDLFVLTPGASTTLVRARDGKALYRGPAMGAAFGDRAAFVYDQRAERLVRVALADGRLTVVRDGLPNLLPVAVRRDGRLLLAVSSGSNGRVAALHVVPLDGGLPRSFELRRPRAGATAAWAGRQIVLFARGETLVFNARLEPARRLPRLAGVPIVRGRIAYAADGRGVRTLDLKTGKRSLFAEFPTGDPLPLAAIGTQGGAARSKPNGECPAG